MIHIASLGKIFFGVLFIAFCTSALHFPSQPSVAMFRRYSTIIRPQQVRCMVHMSSKGRPSASDIKESTNKKDITKTIVNPPKGTRDFYPEDQRLQKWLFNKWHDTAALFGFEEYDAPVVESEELYIRKAGEEITEQLYNFVDKGGRRLSLRPEMTPSLTRMILSKGKSLALPLKWYSIPQCWRYERMTRGRRREHYQWNMDIWGVSTIDAEAELLAAVVHSMKLMGLSAEDVGIKINSRKVLNSLMETIGISQTLWGSVCVVIDKLDKLPREVLINELEVVGVQRENGIKLLEIVEKGDLSSVEEFIGSDNDSLIELKYLLDLLDSYGIADWLEFDGSVVRGLAYYTGIVFEGFDRDKKLRAICGGGRYDKLLESMGGESVPAVGFGFGDAVIVELLKIKSLIPDVRENSIDIVAYPMDESLRVPLLKVVKDLRAANIRTEIVMGNRKAKWVFQRAERLNASAVVLLGEAELAEGQVVVKDIRSRDQSIIPITAALDHCKNLLGKYTELY